MKMIQATAVLFICVVYVSCGDNNNKNEPEMKDPSSVHPPSQAIPESTRLVNDSVIMPDTIPNNGRQVGNSDSIQRNKQ